MSRRKSARVRHLESGASDHGMYQWFPPTAVNDTVEGRVLEEEDLTPPPAKRQRPISSKKKAPPENLTGNAFLDIKLTGCTSRIEIKTDRHPPGSCPVVGSIPLLKDSDGGTLPAPAEVDGFSFWLYFSEQEDGSLLYWEKTTSDLKKRNSENTNKDFGFWSLKGFPFFADNDFFKGLSRSPFILWLSRVSDTSFILRIFFDPSNKATYSLSGLFRRIHPLNVWRRLFPSARLYRSAPERQHFPKIPVEEVFENLYQSQESYYSELDERVQHPSLNVSLRPYQKAAVRWMLEKEMAPSFRPIVSSEPSRESHPVYSSVRVKDDAHEQELTINRFTGEAILGPAPPLPSLPLGGVLADEMGLGKTVEVLALILCNPSSSHVPDLSSEQKVSYLKPVPSDSPVFVQPIKPVDKATSKVREGKNQLYQRLYNGTYLTALSEWDMTARLRKDEEKKKKNQEFFNTKVDRRSLFECICGKGGSEGVSCEICGLFQHPDCLGYDLSDPARGPFYCPHCWLDQPVVPSRATLIVSPSSICDQWADEIRRHISVQGLKIFVYRGVAKSGYIQPRTLADHDLVLCTYETLQREVNYLDLPHSNAEEGRRFRQPKRYMTTPTPLPCIQWWRLCLDEAQLVETTTKSALMAKRLQAIHRWGVSGTPLSGAVTDVFGLVSYLGLEPYLSYWKQLILVPFGDGNVDPLQRLIHQFMWRTGKEKVLDQIGLTEQKERVSWLYLSPVEVHFYRRTYLHNKAEVARRLRLYGDTETKLTGIDRRTLKMLLNPVLRLRQACVHPYIVQRQLLKMKHSKPKGMEDLLKQLIAKTKAEAEEAQRLFVAARNGRAGLSILKGECENLNEALDIYRENITFAEKNHQDVKMDSLQKLHILHNLKEVLDMTQMGIRSSAAMGSEAEGGKPSQEPGKSELMLKEQEETVEERGEDRLKADNVEGAKNSPASEDETEAGTTGEAEADEAEAGNGGEVEAGNSGEAEAKIAGEEEEEVKVADEHPLDSSRWNDLDYLEERKTFFRKKYMQIFDKLVHASLTEVTDLNLNIEFNGKRFNSKWWLDALENVHGTPDGEELLENIKTTERVRSLEELGAIVLEKVNDIEGGRRCILASLRRLVSEARGSGGDQRREELVSCSVACHLRPEQQKETDKTVMPPAAKRCDLCLCHDSIEAYEGVLFEMSRRRVQHEKIGKDVVVFGELQRGHWEAGWCEKTLKGMLKYASTTKRAGDSCRANGKAHLQWLALLRKEFKPLRDLWRKIFNYISSQDELQMSQERMRFPAPGEDPKKVKILNVVSPHEMEEKEFRLRAEERVAENDLRKSLGQLAYLRNLERMDYRRHGNPDTCPICKEVLGHEWSVISCGHCFCIACLHQLLNQGRKNLNCPVCRIPTPYLDISFVRSSACQGTPGENDDSGIKGFLSTKLEALVRRIFEIRSSEPSAKVLIFSTWNSLLPIVVEALEVNAVPHFLWKSGEKAMGKALAEFKKFDGFCCFVLPLRSGANGLNLIEANHVMLLEPILRASEQHQAVGRVHRIGQSKSTTVHRFLVRETIEERMEEVLGNAPEAELTVGHLRALFSD